MATPLPGVWGIDLGQCALKAIRLENIGGQVTATAFDYIEHPKILSQPDADPDELTREALQQFLSRNSLRGDMVVVSVPGQSGLARFVKLPPVEEKKIADIVKFEAKQQIPFPLEEVVWDYQKIGQGLVTDGFAMETEIGLFAMKKDMVYRALQQFKDVHVEVHLIQMAPLALCNYVSYDLLHKDVAAESGAEGADKKECVVALDIGTDNSNLIITDGEKIIWQRPIPLGGNHFTRALTKDMKLTFAKAEHLKRNAVKSPDLKKILSSLKTVLNDFVGEVQRSLGYFTNTHRDASIQYMIGLGNAFRLPGLQKYLQEKLQLEVRKLAKLERVTGEEVTAAPTFNENLLGFAVAYGLALQGLKLSRIQTNLLPYEIRVERIVRGKKPWAVAAAAALLLAVAGLTFGYSKEKKVISDPEIKKQMEAAKSVVTQITALRADYEKELKRKETAEKVNSKIAAGVPERFNWQRIYRYVNLALPRPNGERLVEVARSGNTQVRKTYFTTDAQTAYKKLEAKRVGKTEGTDSAKDEEFIKTHLTQINVEGINALWCDDLSIYFKRMITETLGLIGMKPEERDQVLLAFSTKADETTKATLARAKLPKDGWVFEIRGYTYNKGQAAFVQDTIVENLNYPDAFAEKLPDDLKEIAKQVSHIVLYRNEPQVNPLPGKFWLIDSSWLKTVLRAELDPALALAARDLAAAAGATPDVSKLDREQWNPMGSVATEVHQNASRGKLQSPVVTPGTPPPGASRVPRTEFVVFFVWREPLGGVLPFAAPEPKKN